MNRIIGLVLVVMIAAKALYAADYTWSFEEVTGSATASNEVPTINFDLMNTTTLHQDGKFGKCLEFTFSSVADYIKAENNTFAQCQERFTFSMWVYPYTTPYSNQKEIFFGKPYNSTSLERGYQLAIVNGEFRFSISNSDGTGWDYASVGFGNYTQPNQWYHIAVTWDKTSGAIYGYLNGVPVLIGNKNTSICAVDLPLELGRYNVKYNQLDYSYKGRIDEVAVYDHALSASEVLVLYNQTPAPVVANWYEATGGIHYSEGNVGIGTYDPQQKLQISGTASATGSDGEIPGIIGMRIFNESATGHAGIEMQGGGSNKVLLKYTDNGTKCILDASVEGTNPFDFKVDGIVVARAVQITQDGWADFVFDPSYKLASLSEVEKHIQAKKHLPEIPTAAEVAEQGVDVGEMQAKLLQKVEELTLYLIEQDKRIEKLEKENRELRDN